jgi:hypothetical protein
MPSGCGKCWEPKPIDKEAGPNRPGICAFKSPRPQLLRNSTKERLMSMIKNAKPSDWDPKASSEGSLPIAFFGASPVVASALDLRSGATPTETYTLAKEDSHLHVRSHS